MPSHKLRNSLVAGAVAVVVVGGGAIAAVGPERLHEKIFGEDEHESVSEFAREHQGINMHSQAVATVMEKLEGGEEVAYGPNQMTYENEAFPRSTISGARVEASHDAYVAAKKRALVAKQRAAAKPLAKQQAVAGIWKQIPNARGRVPGAVTYTGNPSHVSGRVTAIVVAPNGRTTYVGTAGGGVWKTDDITARHPAWRPISDAIPSNAIGSLTLAKGVLYVGTGEPNGSSDSEAGVGLFKSTNGGRTFTEVKGFHAYAQDRSVSSIAVDPTNPQHLLVGTALARHGSSSVNGGRMTPPGAHSLGLFESTDGGATWTQVIDEPQDPVIGSSANGSDFFRGGVSKVEFDPNDPTTTYASVFDYGLYRRMAGESSYTRIYSIHNPGAAATSSTNRIEFDATRYAGKTRIYLGDSTRFNDAVSGLLRTDDATAATVTWTDLSSPDKSSTGYDSYNFCQGQCSYDMVVSTPKGRPDTVLLSGSMNYGEIFTAHQPSNGRAIVRSTNAGVSFTDMTNDVANNGLHPDQHALAFLPGHPDEWVLGDDGGVAVESGPFVDKSADCASRGLSGDDLANCQRWLSAIPTRNHEVNSGLQTLQFQSMTVAQGVVQGGTQDNGTWESDMADGPAESVGGDGGNSYINPAHSRIRIHTYYNPQVDVNFHGSKPTGWDWIADPLLGSGETSSFYIPVEGDLSAPGTIYTGLQHVWRTTDNGGEPATLDQYCNEFTGDFSITCGDWEPLGGSALNGPGDLSGTAYGADNAGAGNYVVALAHARKANILWAATRRGRLFISLNADSAVPSAVTFTRLDQTAVGGPLPTRFISGISVDPKNPYHALISYSGYSAYAAGGHLYDVVYQPSTGTIKATDISGDLGDQPITAVAKDWHTGATYIGTDWGVQVQPGGSSHWLSTSGMPPVAVYGLTMNRNGTQLYAATHGRGWYVDRIG
jgi:hypothetical protein